MKAAARVHLRWTADRALTLRVAARYQRAFEFPSPEALKKYLHDHPDADKSKHTVKKPGDHDEKKPEGDKGEAKKDDHGHGGEKPKKSWKDMFKSLSAKAKNFVEKAPGEIKKFVMDEDHRYEVLFKANKAISEAPAKFVHNAIKETKHEVEEIKHAGKSLVKVMKGGKLDADEKKNLRKIATHVAIAATAGALGAGIGASVAMMAKGAVGAFVSSMSKKIALKAVARHLEHLPTVEELSHIGHGGEELIQHIVEHLDKLAAEDIDPQKAFEGFIAGAVAKELKDLDPDVVKEALEDAARDESA